jgi:hypothetical protein
MEPRRFWRRWRKAWLRLPVFDDRKAAIYVSDLCEDRISYLGLEPASTAENIRGPTRLRPALVRVGRA